MKKLISLFVFCLSLCAQAGEAVFIVNMDVQEAKISKKDLSDILLGGQTKWKQGALIKLVLLSAGPIQEKVSRDIAQRTPDQLEKQWKKLVFTGKGTMPAIVKTDSEVVDYVAKTPGAIGFVDQASVSASVKVIEVQ